ncbi:hypothetical protein GCM10008090_01260 [Arenicella chitinivorans]|uniref:Uncharacterized protein n=1 Tax=Arenicella chitinivorans TaxID=1329800 RepID=A0A918RGG9_9GAMM|nr:hypothetical protein [Arenicella chitinivorans]GGZ96768.1 hypothetical protein GCM10008090_01260 [Arenicella chitinivorans]
MSREDYDKSVWEPLSDEGANFCTFRLRDDFGAQNLTFNPSMLNLIVSVSAAIVGISILGYLSFFEPVDLFGADSGQLGSVFTLVAGLVFLLMGIWMMLSLFNTISFDVSTETVYIRRIRPFGMETLAIPFSRVNAVQLLKKTIKARGSYDTYELNLIHIDGSRTMLVTHGSKRVMDLDAQRIGKLLGRSVVTNAR